MIVALCIDDKNGMLFNNRRQSRDKALIEDFVKVCGDKKIYISSFSAELFSEYTDKIVEDENFLENTGSDDICFVENIDLTAYADKINKIILYRWNRHYPSSFRFMLDMSQYKITNHIEFQGNSHEKIVREEYSK